MVQLQDMDGYGQDVCKKPVGAFDCLNQMIVGIRYFFISVEEQKNVLDK